MLSLSPKTSADVAAPTAVPRRGWPWSKLAVGLVAAVLLQMLVTVDSWKEQRVTKYDVFGYYLYLPATFIYHDLGSLSFVPTVIDQYQLTNRGNPAHPLGTFDVSRARTDPDRYVIKYTMGLAILYFPFFEAAHFYTRHFSSHPPDGYSPPYQAAAFVAGLAYALLGLLLLRRFLRYYFSEGLTALLLVVVYCGTNYLCYSVARGLYSHNFLFVLHAATLLLTHHWLQRPQWRYALGLAFTIGLAVLIRPTEIIVGLVPLLLGVASLADFQRRLGLLWQHRGQLALFGVGVFLVWLPQLLYWHHMSGHWVYDSYPGETFNFKHPRLKSGLFSFNNGWLTYTPVMALALVGIGVLWWRRRGLFWLSGSYMALHLWISFSWWCWWYMDSFGSRAMVQTYPLLCLPLGFLLRELLRRGKVLATATVAGLAWNSLNASSVSSGSHSPCCVCDSSPANTFIHETRRSPPNAFSIAASNTRTEARQMSGPVPSPSTKGMTGWLGTLSTPWSNAIASPSDGRVAKRYVAMRKPGCGDGRPCQPAKLSGVAERSKEREVPHGGHSGGGSERTVARVDDSLATVAQVRRRSVEQVPEHVGRRVAVAAGEQLRHGRDVVTAGDQRKLDRVSTRLRQPDIRRETVAEAAATHRVLGQAALLLVRIDRLCRAAIANSAGSGAKRDAKISQIAIPFAGLILARHAAGLDDLEGIACRRRPRVGADSHRACDDPGDHLTLVFPRQSRFVAEREQRPDLNTSGPGGAGGANRTRRARTAGEPEGEVELAHLREVHDVALSVDRLAFRRETRLPPRRRVVPARGGSLDDEPIDPPRRLAGERRR